MSSTNLDAASSSLINNDHQTPSSSTPSPPTKQTQSKSSTTSSVINTNNNNNTAAGEYLLERLRILLNRLQSTTEILHNWPETQGDSAKAHVETCSELITSIRKIVLGVRSVERHVNGTGTGLTPSSTCSGSSSNSSNTPQLASISPEALIAFQTSLDTKCPIPLDLLDLLDVSTTTTATSNTSSIFGLNPQVYIRGLLKESIRQLAGLERRKHALNMLATSIEEGMIAMNSSEKKEGGKVEEEGTTDGKEEKNVKRKREYDKNNIEGEGESVKKIRYE